MMNKNTVLEQIESMIDIVEYASKFTELKKSGAEYKGLCPIHKEKTPSFSVNQNKGLFKCFGCGASGSIINLRMFLEKIDFSEALRRFSDELNIERVNLSEQEKKYYESLRNKEEVYSLILERMREEVSIEVYEFLENKYGITSEAVDAAKIGYIPDNSEETINKIFGNIVSDSEDEGEMQLKTGFWWGDITSGKQGCNMGERIFFPHFNKNRIGHFTNRLMPSDSTSEKELSMKSKNLRKEYEFFDPDTGEISLTSTWANQSLPYFTPDELVKHPDYLIIVEGVGDALSIASYGFRACAVLKNTVHDAQLPYIVSFVRHRKIKKIIIWSDYDPPKKEGSDGAGLSGAKKSAFKIAAKKKIPLILIAKIDEEKKTDPADYILYLKNDLKFNEYEVEEKILKMFSGFQTPEDKFEKIDAIEDKIRNSDLDEIEEEVLPIIKTINNSLVQDTYLQKIKKKFPDINKSTLVSLMKKEEEANTSGSTDHYEFDMRPGEEMFRVLKEKSGRFFLDLQTEQMLLYIKNKLYKLDKKIFSTRTLMFDLFDISFERKKDVIAFDELKMFAAKTATKISAEKKGTWVKKYLKNNIQEIYLSFSGQTNDMLRISAFSMDIVKNPDNDSGVMLNPSESIPEFRLQKFNHEQYSASLKLFKALIIDNCTFNFENRFLAACWMLAAPLKDWAETHPILKTSGPASSGKTTFFKLLTALLYKKDTLGTLTTAAMYEESSQKPLVVLDNYENKDLTNSVRKFLIIASTSRERTKMGGSEDTTTQTIGGMVGMTSIEPVTKTEIVSRILDVEASEEYIDDEKRNSFNLVFDEVKEKRDFLLSGWMNLIGKVLNEDIETRKKQISRRFFDNKLKEKSRLGGYLALMAIVMIELGKELGLNPESIENIIEGWVRIQEESSVETLHEISPTLSALKVAESYIMRLYRTSLTTDYFDRTFQKNAVVIKKEKSEIFLILTGSSSDLYTLLTKTHFEEKRTLASDIRNETSFGARLNNDKKILKNEGWDLSEKRSSNKRKRILKKKIGEGIPGAPILEEELWV